MTVRGKKGNNHRKCMLPFVRTSGGVGSGSKLAKPSCTKTIYCGSEDDDNMGSCIFEQKSKDLH